MVLSASAYLVIFCLVALSQQECDNESRDCSDRPHGDYFDDSDKNVLVIRNSRLDYVPRVPRPPVTSRENENLTEENQDNCGPDNICIPDLRLKVSQSAKSTRRIWVEVEVDNNGEDSYGTKLYLAVPSALVYVNFDRLDSSEDVPISCSVPAPSAKNTLICDIGNPLPTYSKAHFRLYFQPRHGTEVKFSSDFLIVVNSTNPKDHHTQFDNIRTLTFHPIGITDLKVFGASHPEPVSLNTHAYRKEPKSSEADIGSEVIHVYEVRCLGPNDIESAEVMILWPSFLKDKRSHLLYLLEQPFIEGPAKCDHVDEVNPLRLRLLTHKFEGLDDHYDHPTTYFSREMQSSLNKRSWTEDRAFQRELSCGQAACTQIRCQIGKLARNQSVVFWLRGRIWSDTILRRFPGDVTLTSKLIAWVTSLPNTNLEYPIFGKFAITTTVEIEKQLYLKNSDSKISTEREPQKAEAVGSRASLSVSSSAPNSIILVFLLVPFLISFENVHPWSSSNRNMGNRKNCKGK